MGQRTEMPSGGEAGEHHWHSYVAVGDSFTEGLQDPGPEGRYRGWADRLATRLAATANGPGQPFHYANIAVRGKLIREIAEVQVPRACAMGPNLVTIAAGGNDIIRPGTDPDEIAEIFDGAVAQLRAAGAEVLIGTGFDTRETPVLRRLRGKIGTYNAHLRAIADKHGCRVLDLWSMRVLQDARAWDDDRLHLSSEGHRRVSLAACEGLGITPGGDWREPWPDQTPTTWQEQRAEDLRWAREYLAPWISRRLRGRSSGDGRCPKRPRLEPVQIRREDDASRANACG